MKLRLTLKPGQSHGGVVKLERFEVSDPDGAKLIPGTQEAVVPLSGRASIALSEARPNPSRARRGSGSRWIADRTSRSRSTTSAGGS